MKEVNVKKSMSKRLFGWTKSSKRSDKLITDAVVLEENNKNVGDSSEGIQSTALSVSRLSQEMGISQQFDNQHISLIRQNGSLVEPYNTANGALSVNNTNQHIYQISNTTGVHIGPNYQINNVVQQQSPDQRSNSRGGDTVQKTKSIVAMMASNQPINKNIMEVISAHLGKNWRSLFRGLHFSDGQIEQMKEDFYINGVKEVIYQLLLDYSRNNDDASLGHITQIMWKLGFNKCAKILKEHYKKGDLAETELDSGSIGGACGKGGVVD